jgi:hypothetical protein
MIRQDWLMRMIREMVQVLARAIALKERSEYGQALKELDNYLEKLRGGPVPEPPDLGEWLNLCLTGEGQVEERLEWMADLWRERGDLLELEQRSVAAHHSYAIALGLYLERVNRGPVNQRLLDRVGESLAQTNEGPLPGMVLHRLLAYYEARGWLSRAEDVVFEWLEGGDAQAIVEGLFFFQRLKGLSQVELEAGNLSKEEVEQGEAEFMRRSQKLVQ